MLPDGQAQQPGEQDYMTICAACHTIGDGRLIGPDLIGVHDRRSQEWLVEFVQSSQAMIERGDPQAVAIFEEYSRIPMPPPPFSEAQVIDIMAFVATASAEVAAGGPPVVLGATPAAGAETQAPNQQATAAVAAAAIADEPVAVPTEADIERGQDLFQGRTRFENGGPTCNSCHDVQHDAVIGGGILAAELTSVFTKLGGRGVQAILGTSPFPVMQAAYQERALTQNEVTSLVSFLQFADQQSEFQTPRDYGRGLFFSGALGAAILFGFFAVLWRGRKRGSVNQSIYDRQVASTWEY